MDLMDDELRRVLAGYVDPPEDSMARELARLRARDRGPTATEMAEASRPSFRMSSAGRRRPDQRGGGEALETIGGALAGSVPAGLAGLAVLPFRGPAGAAETVERVQDVFTPMPTTEGGVRATMGLAQGLAPLGAPAQAVGDVTLRATGSPLAATAAEIMLDPLNAAGLVAAGPALRAGARAAGRGVQRAGQSAVQNLGPKVAELAEAYMRRSGMTPEITTYHGTPHIFPAEPGMPLGRFRAEKIGGGEGSREYGHGLYVAESPEVAKSYKTKDGVIYTVDLPDQIINRMLDWDQPVNESTIEVLKRIKIPNKSLKSLNATDVDDLVFMYSEKTGQEWYDILSDMLGGDAKASEALRKAGIPGIRYLDAGSRAKGEGTRNLVVFPGEEQNLRILGRDGLKLQETKLQPPEGSAKRGDVTRMTTPELEAEAASLSVRVNQAYESGNQPLAERLDARLESVFDALEHRFSEVEEDGPAVPEFGGRERAQHLARMDEDSGDPEADLVRDLANRWKDMTTPGSFDASLSDAEKAANIRMLLDDYAFRHGGLREGLSDQQFLDAAKDAYESVFMSQGRRSQSGLGGKVVKASELKSKPAENKAQGGAVEGSDMSYSQAVDRIKSGLVQGGMDSGQAMDAALRMAEAKMKAGGAVMMAGGGDSERELVVQARNRTLAAMDRALAPRARKAWDGPMPNRPVVNGRAMVSAEELADFRRQFGADKTLRDLLNADKGRGPSAADPRARGPQGVSEAPASPYSDPSRVMEGVAASQREIAAPGRDAVDPVAPELAVAMAPKLALALAPRIAQLLGVSASALRARLAAAGKDWRDMPPRGADRAKWDAIVKQIDEAYPQAAQRPARVETPPLGTGRSAPDLEPTLGPPQPAVRGVMERPEPALAAGGAAKAAARAAERAAAKAAKAAEEAATKAATMSPLERSAQDVVQRLRQGDKSVNVTQATVQRMLGERAEQLARDNPKLTEEAVIARAQRVETGQGVLMPYFKSAPMPDVRTMKAKGGEVKGPLSAAAH